MILDEATFEAFGYCSDGLTSKSHKFIIAVCELCGEFRILRKGDYHILCMRCSHIYIPNRLGSKQTDRAKAKMSAAKKGEKNPNFGKHRSKETKALISAANRGERNWNFKGGKKEKERRHKAKRRELGYTLLLPLVEGEVGHHVTDEYVIGIPKEVHRTFSGGNRQKHRALVLEWLKDNDKKKYLKVVCVLAREDKLY